MINFKNDMLIPVFLLIFIYPAMTGSNISTLDWFLGEWVADDGKYIMFESWHRVSAKTYEGIGITESPTSGEILNSESLRLVEMSGEVFYIAKVEHNEFPIGFKRVEYSDSSVVFENLRHDFPKKIEYQLLKNDHLLVTVSNENKHFSIEYKMKKDSK